jgi:hypothetical protein
MKKNYRLYVECLNNEGWETHITVGEEYQIIGAELERGTKKPVLMEISDDNKQPVIIPAIYFSDMRRKQYKEVAEESEQVKFSIREAVEMVMVVGQIVEHLQKNLLNTIGCKDQWKDDIRKVRFANTAQKNNLLKYISVSKEGRQNAAEISEQLSSEKIQDLVQMVWYANKFHNVSDIAQSIEAMYFEAKRTQTATETIEEAQAALAVKKDEK